MKPPLTGASKTSFPGPLTTRLLRKVFTVSLRSDDGHRSPSPQPLSKIKCAPATPVAGSPERSPSQYSGKSRPSDPSVLIDLAEILGGFSPAEEDGAESADGSLDFAGSLISSESSILIGSPPDFASPSASNESRLRLLSFLVKIPDSSSAVVIFS